MTATMSGGGVIRPRGGGPAAPTIVFHGDADRTVNLVNADQVIAQARSEAILAKAVAKLRARFPDGDAVLAAGAVA